MAAHIIGQTDASNLAAFETQLRTSHRVRVSVRLYDSDDQNDTGYLFEGLVVEGQVDVDLEGTTTRSASLTVIDESNKLEFAPMGAVYADNYLGIEYGVYVESLEAWVDTPIFFGPVSRFSRDGAEVTIEAQGKEALLLPPVKQVIPSYAPADRYLRTVVKDLAQEFGETKFRLAAMRGKKVPGSFSVDAAKVRERGTWWLMQELAASRNLRLEYDGQGYLEARLMNPNKVTYQFRDSLSEPSVSYDLADVRNRVEVWDQDTKGKPDPVVRLDLPASHPLSGTNLGRNDIPRILVERVELSSVRTTPAEGEKIARGILRRHSEGVVDVAFDHLVIPHLNPGDRAALVTSSGQVLPFMLRRFTIPLGAEDSMAVGYTRPTKVRKGKFKYRRRTLK